MKAILQAACYIYRIDEGISSVKVGRSAVFCGYGCIFPPICYNEVYFEKKERVCLSCVLDPLCET